MVAPAPVADGVDGEVAFRSAGGQFVEQDGGFGIAVDGVADLGYAAAACRRQVGAGQRVAAGADAVFGNCAGGRRAAFPHRAVNAVGKQDDDRRLAGVVGIQ